MDYTVEEFLKLANPPIEQEPEVSLEILLRGLRSGWTIKNSNDDAEDRRCPSCGLKAKEATKEHRYKVFDWFPETGQHRIYICDKTAESFLKMVKIFKEASPGELMKLI